VTSCIASCPFLTAFRRFVQFCGRCRVVKEAVGYMGVDAMSDRRSRIALGE